MPLENQLGVIKIIWSPSFCYEVGTARLFCFWTWRTLIFVVACLVFWKLFVPKKKLDISVGQVR